MKKITLLLFFLIFSSVTVLSLSVTNITVSSSNGNSIFLNNTITLNALNTTSTNISLDGIDTYNARIDNKNAGLTYIYLFNISSAFNVIRYNGDNSTIANLSSGSIITLQAAPYYIEIGNFTNTTTSDGNNGGNNGGNTGGGGGGGGSGSSSGSTATITTDYEATVGPSTPLTFTLASNGEKHKVIINEVHSDSVTLTVESTPQKVTMILGETKEFDLDEDATTDISITLLDIIRNKVNLRIISLAKSEQPELIFPHPTKTDYEELPPIVNSPEGTGNAVTSINPLKRFRAYIPWAMMLLIAGIIIYGYYFINRTRKNI